MVLLLAARPAAAQGDTIKYVEWNSVHALSVPENPDYSFIWEITWGYMGANISAGSTTNVTQNITWDKQATYKITVYPVLDSVDCPGEPKVLYVNVVDDLSLHAFDDYYHTPQNTTVYGDVSVNDVDETGAELIYNPTLAKLPAHGTVQLDNFGNFSYTPVDGFIGVDFFTYSVCNDNNPMMCDNAVVTIVVEPKSGHADVKIDKTGPYKALFGGDIEYFLWVKNLGPQTAKNLWVRDEMPFGVFDPMYSYAGQSFKPWPDSLYINELAAGDSVLIRIQGMISKFSPEWLYNQGLVYTDNEDPDPLNNDSIWITHVLPIFVEPRHMVVPSCSTAVIDISSQSVNGVKSYEWHPGTFLSDSTIANPVFTPGSSINYVFTITDSLGNTASDTVFVVVPPAVKAIIPDTFYIDLGETDTLFATLSEGVDIKFSWTTNNGTILWRSSKDSLEIASTGTYYLTVRDQYLCTDTDSVIVLLESHPPIAVNDTVAIVAGTDSTFNILLNDYDINKFTLRVTDILTQPKHHDIFEWDDKGEVTFQPNVKYWGWDSLEYKVCNNGYPEQCSSAWVHIHSLRPPLNADLAITKTGPIIGFWQDSLTYSLEIKNLGPDTAKVTVFDPLPRGLDDATYSTDGGASWLTWNDFITFPDPLLPEEGAAYQVLIKAYINVNAPRQLENKAWVESNMKENDFVNDTATWSSKIKLQVIAKAGPDKVVGACQNGIYLDGSNSQGEERDFTWSPSTYLDNPKSETPYFRYPGTVSVATLFPYVLTVTDNDGISDTDTVMVEVLPAPVADAGPNLFISPEALASPNGNKSTGIELGYKWTTRNGHIFPGTETSVQCIVDTFGVYVLTITDKAGCTSKDSMAVYEFFYPPFAIPDYYSTEFNGPTITGNLIENDFDPNDPILEPLFAVDTTVTTYYGVKVKIDADGIFNYTPPTNQPQGIVDHFTYRVGNNAIPPHYSRGYVKITVGKQLNPPTTNLHIKKYAYKPMVLINREVEWELLIVNKGEESTKVTVNDSMSIYINPPYERAWHKKFMEAIPNEDVSFTRWDKPGQLVSPDELAPGDSIFLRIKGRVAMNSPEIVFNAAMASSTNDDPLFDWLDDLEDRNVDTARVYVQSGVLTHLELVERSNLDLDHNDLTVGSCDRVSYLDGSKSEIENDLTQILWSPSQFLDIDPKDSLKAYLKEGINDTTIVFSLTLFTGDRLSTDSVEVKISTEPLADAGPDRKINPGDSLVIDGTNSYGAGASYSWWDASDSRHDALQFYDDGNILRPIVNQPGSYVLFVSDKHGCFDSDTVTIRENSLHPVNDMALVIEGYSILGNVSFNDFDPDLDSVYYHGEVVDGKGPFNGTLEANPPQIRFGADTLTSGRVIAHDGSYRYTPNPGFIGHDQFTYTLCDNNEPDLCLSATVYISVLDIDSINTPPVANPEALFVVKDDTLWVNIIMNDLELDGNKYSVNTSPVRYPSAGNITLTADGDLLYTPTRFNTGYDQFTYRLCDDGKPAACDTAIIAVRMYKVIEENHRPMAVDDAFFMVEKPLTGAVLENDYDPDRDDNIVVSTDLYILPRYGTIYNNATQMEKDKLNYDGTFLYIPNEGFEGTDWFVYEICDDDRKDPKCAHGTAFIVSLDESRYHTDLMVSKDGPEEIVSNSLINYTLTVTAKGPTFVNDVVLSDTINALLANAQFSYNGSAWAPWEGSYSWERFKIGEQHSISIRAQLPPDLDTLLVNTAWAWHDMVESDSIDNRDTLATRVYQRVIAHAGFDTVVGACVPKVTLDGTRSVGMNNSTLEYSWKPTGMLTNPNTARPVFNTTPGTHKFTLIVSNTHKGFTDHDTAFVTVTVAPFPMANAGPDQWPEDNTPVILDGSMSTGAGPLGYFWWKYNKQGKVDTLGFKVNYTATRTGDYWLTVTDTLGCKANDMVHVGFPIDAYEAIDDEFEVYQQHTDTLLVLENDLIDEEDEYTGSIIVTNGPFHGTQRFDPVSMSILYTPEDYFCADRDSFEYTVSTQSGQTASAWVKINVLCLDPIVPFGFSPNGDGINETLIIENIELYPESKLQVFNRWGNLVYQKERYSNDQPWDGIANKGLRIGHGVLPTAAYLYILELGNLGEKNRHREILKGYIYIASDRRR